MLTAVWRWIHGSRRRRITCFVTLFVQVLLVAWFWSDFCLWRADANLVLRRNEAAEKWIHRSRWGRDHSTQTCLLQLRVARRLGRYHDVEKLLQQGQQCGVPIAELRREQWLAMAQTQQFDQVSLHWSDLLSDPRDDEPEIARAFVVWASSHHLISEALRVLTLWEQDCPNDPEAFALHGQLAVAMNQDETAVDSYRKALTLAPSNNNYRLALANALQKRLQLDEAARLFQECVERMPDSVAAIRGLAATHVSQGDIEKALSILQNAIKRFPDDLELHQTLGESLLAKGDDAAAVTHLERVHSAYPENADIAYSLAQALKSLKRDAEAAVLFDFVAESREPLASLKTLEEQIAARPNDLELRFKIASISAKYKSRREAIRWLEKLLLISPSYRPAHESLADLYRLTGDAEKATRHQKLAEGVR